MTAYVVSYLLSRVLLGVSGGGSLRRVLLGGVRSVLLGVRGGGSLRHAMRAKTEHRWLRQSRLAQLGQEEVSW
jgi:hypothetical protein